MHFDTLAMRAGAEADPETGAVAPPIHLSTTFEHGPDGELPHGYLYGRYANPTQDRLETALAAIDGGSRALAFASGLAATSSFLQALPAGGHVLFADDVYFDVRTIARDYLPRWGLTASHVDMTDLAAVRAALRPETTLLWVETPSNPRLKVADIAALAELAHGIGARLLVDGTFATPALQQPLALGADYVLHSLTKYLGGHTDVLGGAVVFRADDEVVQRCFQVRKTLGAIASPFGCWLVLRGIRSLAVRMERHAANAQAVAEALAAHPSVEAVHYPGLPSHPQHAVAARQMKAFGGMLSFQVRGGLEAAVAVVARVKLFTVATSLGGVESLIEHRASIEGPASPTPANLIRVSVGLEHAGDLIDDLLQALD